MSASEISQTVEKYMSLVSGSDGLLFDFDILEILDLRDAIADQSLDLDPVMADVIARADSLFRAEVEKVLSSLSLVTIEEEHRAYLVEVLEALNRIAGNEPEGLWWYKLFDSPEVRKILDQNR